MSFAVGSTVKLFTEPGKIGTKLLSVKKRKTKRVFCVLKLSLSRLLLAGPGHPRPHWEWEGKVHENWWASATASLIPPEYSQYIHLAFSENPSGTEL